MNRIRLVDADRGSILGTHVERPVVFADPHRSVNVRTIRRLRQRDVANIPRVTRGASRDDSAVGAGRDRRLAAVADAGGNRAGTLRIVQVGKEDLRKLGPRQLSGDGCWLVRAMLVSTAIAALPLGRAGTSRWSSQTATRSPLGSIGHRLPATITSRTAAGDRYGRSEGAGPVARTCRRRAAFLHGDFSST